MWHWATGDMDISEIKGSVLKIKIETNKRVYLECECAYKKRLWKYKVTLINALLLVLIFFIHHECVSSDLFLLTRVNSLAVPSPTFIP